MGESNLATAVTPETTDQYLTFTLDSESFATEISKVREVLEYTQITKVPRVPDFLRGVINLRGSVVPVVDLRLQFGMPELKPTIDTCIIILELELNGQQLLLGALADSVQEVIELSSGGLEQPPSLGNQVDTRFIKSMAKHEGRFVIILDINQIFSIQALDQAYRLKESGDVVLPGRGAYAPAV